MLEEWWMYVINDEYEDRCVQYVWRKIGFIQLNVIREWLEVDVDECIPAGIPGISLSIYHGKFHWTISQVFYMYEGFVNCKSSHEICKKWNENQQDTNLSIIKYSIQAVGNDCDTL